MSGIALVTGASSGIGRSLAQQLAERGVRVHACARSKTSLASLVESHPDVTPHACDLADAQSRTRLCQTLLARTDPLDLLVNNAGVQFALDFTGSIDEAAVEREIATNLTAPILLTAALLPALRRSGNPRIVNISSALAIAPKRSAPVYCASKAALSTFSRGLRYQVGAGVRVIDVVAPLVRTRMTSGRDRGAMEPDEFVLELLRRIEAGSDEIWVGRARALRLIHRLSPRIARRILRDQ